LILTFLAPSGAVYHVICRVKLASFKTFKPFNRPVELRPIFHRAPFKALEEMAEVR